MTSVSSVKLPPKGAFSVECYKIPQDRKKAKNKEFESEDSKKVKNGELESEEEPNESLEFAEMFEYAQLALEKTSEVQADINNLFSLWENQSAGQDEEYLKLVDNLLEENNMKPLGPAPGFKKVLKVVVSLLAEIRVLRESFSGKSDFQGVVRGYQKHIKSLEKELGLIKKQLDEYHEISVKQVEDDRKMLREIQESVGAESEEEILGKIESYKGVVKVVPSLEIFVQEVCKELVPEIVEDEKYESFAKGLKEVFPRIKALKAAIEELTEFKIKVYKGLKIPISANEVEAVEKVSCVAYFEKLFEVDTSEDIFDVMEKLFLYYRESKSIMDKLKVKLKLSQTLGGFHLLQELKRIL